VNVKEGEKKVSWGWGSHDPESGAGERHRYPEFTDKKSKVAVNPQLMVAGGFLRSVIAGEKTSDIDFFAESQTTLQAAADRITIERRGKQHVSHNAITVLAPPRTPLQFITRWTFDNPEDCMASFDFTIAQAMIYRPNSGQWEAWVADRFFQDLAQKRLIYTSPDRDEDAGGSMMRVLKFLKKGYSIQAESLGKVIARIVRGIDMTKMEGDGHHSTEEWWGTIVTGLLREVDPLMQIDGFTEIVDEHAELEDL
jgi:hypothetical protein